MFPGCNPEILKKRPEPVSVTSSDTSLPNKADGLQEISEMVQTATLLKRQA